MKKLTGKNYSNSGGIHKNEPESDPSPSESDFSSLYLSEIILKWLNHKNFKRMTKVQSLCLKQFLKRENDVLVQSCTGSGKTLCFLIPILNSFLHDTNLEFEHLLDVFAVIILPTRELSIQIFDIINDFLQFTHCNTSCVNGSVNSSVDNNLVEDNSLDNLHRNVFIRNVYRIMKRNVYNILLIGGTSVETEVRNMKKACEKTFVKSLVVATPGRLRHVMDLLSHEFVWTFRNLRFLILDEADRLLEMGFQNDLSNILTHLPKQRQTGLFSATLNTGIQDLSKLCLHNHIHINTDSTADSVTVHSVSTDNKTYTIPKGLNNYYLILSMEEKLSFVLSFLEHLKGTDSTKIVIFFLSCDLVNYYHQVLSNLMLNGGTGTGSTTNNTTTNTTKTTTNTNTPTKTSTNTTTNKTINILKIHRKMTSKKRNKSINMFKSGTRDCINVLLCTDVFSRGIDVPGIDWILQFDPPQDPNFYLHRIGRAGRAETPGNALLLLTETEESYIQFQHNRKITLQPLPSNLLNSIITVQNSLNSTFTTVFDDTINDTLVEGDVSYLTYLRSNPVEKPVLLWDKTAVVLSYLRFLNSKDRELLLLSSRAFVSYTRAYSEHSLKYIFEKQKLDYGALATSLGVLRIPRVKEILGRKILHFVQSTINPKDVPYLDPEKEANRLKQMELLNTTHDKENFKSKLDKQNKDKDKVNVKDKVKRTRTMKREAKRRIEFDEWNEFRKEEALVKKLKKKGFNQKDIENLNNDDCEFGDDLELEVESSKRWILRGKKRNKRKKH